MAVLSAQTIRKVQQAHGLFTPYSERAVHADTGMSYGLSSAGYDIRLGRPVTLDAEDRFALAVSMERFRVPPHLLGRVHDKSTWARRGLFVQNTIIEPGWEGWLTLELTWAARLGGLWIDAGTPIAQICFEALDAPTEQVYRGKYQDQPNVPVEAKREGV